MTKSKHTKRALLASSLSVLLCLAMLVGLTFAWFTDTASTSVNGVQAGTLDVQLLNAADENLEGQTLNFVKAEGNEPLLWEPGCTYSLPAVYVKNNGNLALKYKLMISGIVGDAKLLEAIDWTIKVGSDVITDLATFKGKLAAGTKSSDALVLTGHMREAAGNEYQGLSIDGIAITVTATQDTVEYDSTTDQYDAAADYDYAVHDVIDNDSLNAAIAQGGIITLPVSDNQVTLGNNQAIGGDTVIDMSGSSQPIQNSIRVKDGMSLTMNNGTLEKNGTFGKIRFDNKKGLDSEGETQAGIFNDMTFKNTTGGVTDMVQIVPRGDSTGKYIFRNCHFIDANVVINGLAGDEYGDNGQVEIVFENCTFDINGSTAIDFSSNYCTGSMTVKDCTFNMTTSASSSSTAIRADGSKALSLTFAGTNYINNNGAGTVWAYTHYTRATVTGEDTIATTGTVSIP